MKLIVLVLITIIAIGCGPTIVEEPSGAQKQPTSIAEAPKALTASPTPVPPTPVPPTAVSPTGVRHTAASPTPAPPTPVPPRANTGESGSGPSNTAPMVTAQDTYANCTFEFTSTPAHGETDVPRDTQIVQTSNVPIDVSTINSNRFVVKGAVSGVVSGMFLLPVTGTVTAPLRPGPSRGPATVSPPTPRPIAVPNALEMDVRVMVLAARGIQEMGFAPARQGFHTLHAMCASKATGAPRVAIFALGVSQTPAPTEEPATPPPAPAAVTLAGEVLTAI